MNKRNPKNLMEPAIVAGLSEAELRQAKELNLRGMGLSSLPEDIGDLTNLKSLDLSWNQLRELPEGIGNLTNLTSLDLSWNQLRELPEGIGNLTNLTSLNLWINQLSELPYSIGNLTNLTKLNLSNNQLNKLIETIGEMPNLTKLNLSDNQLNKLPESIGNLTNLTKLNLSDNQLNKLPYSIGNLTNLTKLNLSDNQLNKLPYSIGNLTNLTEIELMHNQLSELPESIGELTNLIKLTLRDNQLNKLSTNQLNRLIETIGEIPNLTELNLSWNQLSELPDDIKKLEQLDILELRGNRLKKPIPQSIANWGSDVVLGMLELGGQKLSGPKKLFVSLFRLPPSFSDPISLLALTECFAAFITACWLAIVHPVWLTGACIIAPLFLLRTRQSSYLALKFTDRLGVRLKIKDEWDKYGIRQLYRYPAYALGAWGVKVWASLRPLFRKPGKSAHYLMQLLIALRKNYNYQLTRINIRTAPEIVPGLENRYSRSPKGLLSFFEIGMNPAEAVYRYVDTRLSSRVIQIAMMAIIFSFAFIYRFTVKLSLIFYFPVFFVGFFTENLIESNDQKAVIKQFLKQFFSTSVFLSIIFGKDIGQSIGLNQWLETTGLFSFYSSVRESVMIFLGDNLYNELLEVIRWGFILLIGLSLFLNFLAIVFSFRPNSDFGKLLRKSNWWLWFMWVVSLSRDLLVFGYIGYMMQFYFSAVLYDKISDWFVLFMI